MKYDELVKELRDIADMTNWEAMIQEAADAIITLQAELKQCRKDSLREGYLLGFNDSGEGFNGEYPYGDRNINPESDSDWCEGRDAAIYKAMESV